jgi:hypothetical protein
VHSVGSKDGAFVDTYQNIAYTDASGESFSALHYSPFVQV